MNDFLNDIQSFFVSLGIHPVFGSFLVGVVFMLVLRRKGAPGGVTFNHHAEVARVSTASMSHAPVGLQNVQVAKTQSFHVNPIVSQKIIDLARKGYLIEAIKEFRAATGLGLKEAKEIVEAMTKR